MNKKARNFALYAHANQMYGTSPYIVHLDAVASIARKYDKSAEIIAYLHDVIEDTDIEINEIVKEFGVFVANCVSILSDEPGESRKERKSKTEDWEFISWADDTLIKLEKDKLLKIE